jgi:transposase
MKWCCPNCGHPKRWQLAHGRWRCAACRSTWQRQRATWISHLRTARPWLKKLVRYFVLGVPAYRLRFMIPLSPTTVERLYRRIREAIYVASLTEMTRLAGQIEADETMFGGSRPGKRGWGASGKVLVFGLYQRNGKVLIFPVASRKRAELIPLLLAHTHPGSLYYTDDWHAYTSLPIRQRHVVISKIKGIPRGREHINGIEGFWSYAKHWLYPYRGVPVQYFHLYLKEIEFRFNHREKNLLPLIINLLNRCRP